MWEDTPHFFSFMSTITPTEEICLSRPQSLSWVLNSLWVDGLQHQLSIVHTVCVEKVALKTLKRYFNALFLQNKYKERSYNQPLFASISSLFSLLLFLLQESPPFLSNKVFSSPTNVKDVHPTLQWYFTTKSLVLSRKKEQNLSPNAILQGLTKHASMENAQSGVSPY